MPEFCLNILVQSRPRLTKALEEHILDGLIDPRMGANYDPCDMQRLIACAAAAVRHTARSRPRMSQVTYTSSLQINLQDFSRTLTVHGLFVSMNLQIVRYLEGQLSVEALNAGVAPGQSEVLEDHAGEQLWRMRRLAFVPGTTSTTQNMNMISSSYVSEPTSEYGLHPSSSSSDDADTSEVTSSAHRAASRPLTTTGSSATGTEVEGQSSGEIGAAEGRAGACVRDSPARD